VPINYQLRLGLFVQCHLLQEFLKTTVDVADLFGLYLTMSKIPGKGELKVLVAGLGIVPTVHTFSSLQ
jgi:hypothetical protein